MEIVERLIKSFFRLGLDKVIDIAKAQYHEKKTQAIIKKFKSAGQNIVLPAENKFENPQYISMGNNFFALYNLRIEAMDSFAGDSFRPEIIIGDNVMMNSDIHIAAIDKVVIGNNVLMASRIYISDHLHGYLNKDDLEIEPIKRRLSSKGPVIIEENVWIGEGVCVMPGVTIGKNSVIGANAVVTKDVPPNCVAAGVPAKILRYLK